MMHESVWFEFFGGVFYVKTRDLWGKCDNKEEYLHRAQPFPRGLRYKKGKDIIEGDIMKVRVHRCLFEIKHQMTFTYFSTLLH